LRRTLTTCRAPARRPALRATALRATALRAARLRLRLPLEHRLRPVDARELEPAARAVSGDHRGEPAVDLVDRALQPAHLGGVGPELDLHALPHRGRPVRLGAERALEPGARHLERVRAGD